MIARAIIPTFECLAETVCKGLEPGWRNGKTAARWRSNISIHARTLLDKPVDQITTTDVEEVLRPIWTTHAETASQLRGHIERIMAAAKVNGFRSGENPAHGWIIGVNKMSQDRIGSEATLKNRNGVRQSSGAVRGGVMM